MAKSTIRLANGLRSGIFQNKPTRPDRNKSGSSLTKGTGAKIQSFAAALYGGMNSGAAYSRIKIRGIRGSAVANPWSNINSR